MLEVVPGTGVCVVLTAPALPGRPDSGSWTGCVPPAAWGVGENCAVNTPAEKIKTKKIRVI
jgi:hypothetical protein